MFAIFLASNHGPPVLPFPPLRRRQKGQPHVPGCDEVYLLDGTSSSASQRVLNQDASGLKELGIVHLDGTLGHATPCDLIPIVTTVMEQGYLSVL